MLDSESLPQRMRLPNLVIAGVGKAGTSSLFRYLAQHPAVCGSVPKELRYFTPLRYGARLGDIEQYAAHFEKCGPARYAMEATPGYFFGGVKLVDALDDLLPQPRVIVILRDPVTRFWSYYNFQRSRGGVDVTLSFDEYLHTCQALRSAGEDGLPENNPYWALSSGFYADYIEDWYRALGDRFRVIFFEDMVRDPRGVCVDLFTWLELDPSVASEIDYSPVNKTVQYRNSVVRQIAGTLSLRLRPWLTSKPRLRQVLSDVHRMLNRDPKKDLTLTSEIRQRLADVYEPANQRLAQQLVARGHVELPPWLASTAATLLKET